MARHRQAPADPARKSQIATLREAKDCNTITLTKELGETAIEGQGMLDAPPWKWPERQPAR